MRDARDGGRKREQIEGDERRHIVMRPLNYYICSTVPIYSHCTARTISALRGCGLSLFSASHLIRAPSSDAAARKEKVLRLARPEVV